MNEFDYWRQGILPDDRYSRMLYCDCLCRNSSVRYSDLYENWISSAPDEEWWFIAVFRVSFVLLNLTFSRRK